MNMIGKYALVVSVLFLALIFSGKTASAIEYGMLGGKPANPDRSVANSDSWFIYNISPGEAKEDAIEVMNLFGSSLDVVIYPADTIKSSGGGFALKQFSEKNQEVGTWVKFYPDPVPQYFQGIFEKKEKKILALCNLSKEDIQKEEEFKEIEIGEEQFLQLQDWCKGKEIVERSFASKERLQIPFVISIPLGVDVGEHTGGIMIQKKSADDASQDGGSNVKLTTRVGVRIYENVPGEIVKRINLESFKVEKHFLQFDFSDWFGEIKKPKEFLIETNISNSGNVSIEHENNIYIRDLLFKKKNEDVTRKFQVLRGDKFIANYSWKKPLFGYYSFQAEIKYDKGLGEEILKSDLVKMWVIPWRELSLLALASLLIGSAVFFWMRKRKKLYGGIGWIGYQVEKSDTIANLSEKCGIDWKILAKTNRIKPPYLFSDGQRILLPPIAKSIFSNEPRVARNASLINLKVETSEMTDKKKKKNVYL